MNFYNLDMTMVGRIIAIVIGGLFLGLGIAKLWLGYKRRKQKGETK